MPGSPPGGGERVPGPDPGGDPRTSGSPRLRALVLLGPTGTGKTETALIVSEIIGAEIIGCDAVQVYRGLDAATAKPTPAERQRIRHHVVDFVDPRHDFSLADYVLAAETAISDVAGRGKVPFVVGGTGLYLRGLLRGIVPAPPRDSALRSRLLRMESRFGSRRLHRWLARLDPESAERLPSGDTQRIVRALEIALIGGGTWSERLRREGTWESGDERYATLKVGLDMERDDLDRRLRDRVNGFFAGGLVREVRGLLAAGVPSQANALKAIGYREVLAALERGDDPEGVREDVYRNTKRFVKRQRTWFRKERNVTWLDASERSRSLAKRIVELWRGDRNR